jgi:hypothetical protein
VGPDAHYFVAAAGAQAQQMGTHTLSHKFSGTIDFVFCILRRQKPHISVSTVQAIP